MENLDHRYYHDEHGLKWIMMKCDEILFEWKMLENYKSDDHPMDNPMDLRVYDVQTCSDMFRESHIIWTIYGQC